MTPQFITLPSGLRVNTAHILEYREVVPGKTIIRQNCKGFDSVASFEEDMTAEQLDALLSTPSSPIVEAVVNLDNLKPGKACCFTREGKVRHGVIDYFAGEGVYVAASADGHAFTIFLETV